jgi:hypothetical protein
LEIHSVPTAHFFFGDLEILLLSAANYFIENLKIRILLLPTAHFLEVLEMLLLPTARILEGCEYLLLLPAAHFLEI